MTEVIQQQFEDLKMRMADLEESGKLRIQAVGPRGPMGPPGFHSNVPGPQGEKGKQERPVEMDVTEKTGILRARRAWNVWLSSCSRNITSSTRMRFRTAGLIPSISQIGLYERIESSSQQG